MRPGSKYGDIISTNLHDARVYFCRKIMSILEKGSKKTQLGPIKAAGTMNLHITI